eukprot:259846_1
MCTAFAFAEFASRIPVVGGVYTYVYNSSGEFIAYQMAWQGILAPLSASINAIGAVGYFKSFLISCGIDRNKLNNTIWFGYEEPNNILSINLSAPLLILILTLFAIFDVGLSKNFMNYFTIWNISLLLLFIICGMFLIDTDIYIHPCDHIEFGTQCPSNANNSFFPFGIQGTLSGALIASWAFSGVEGIVSLAEECIDPLHDIPRAIYISLSFITVLYISVVMVINGIIPFQALDTQASLSESLSIHNELLLHQMISLGASSTMSILSFASLIGATRGWFRASADGLCFPFFSYIHPRFRTPFYSIVLYSIVGMSACLLFDLRSILTFSSVAALLNLSCVSVGLLIVRYSPPNDHGEDVIYWWNETRIFGLTWMYLFCCLIFSYVGLNKDYFQSHKLFGLWIVLMVIFGLILIGIIVLLGHFHCNYPWIIWVEKFKTYKRNDGIAHKVYFMPGCPYLPCMLILLNSYMIAGIGLKKIGYLIMFLLFGLPVYFCYSYKNSTLRKQRSSKQVSTMIALTAIHHDENINDMDVDDTNDTELLSFNQTLETTVT